MKIKELAVHNWRSVADIVVKCEDLMVLLGQNNHGKSNILYALLFFFGEIEATEMDFRKGTNDLFVEIEFGELDDHDKKQFKSYLTTENKIRVRKSMGRETASQYNGYRGMPTEPFLNVQSMSKEEFTSSPLASFVTEIPGRITKATLQAAQEAYMAANHATLDLSYSLESTPFLGAKNVAQGIFGRVFFIPAIRDAADELGVKGKSVFNQLFSNVINSMSEKNEEYKDIKDRVSALVNNLNKTDGSEASTRPEEIVKLEGKLESELGAWNTKIEVEITPPDIDALLKVGTNVWIDDGTRTDIGRKGHGLQRSVIFALIKSWASVLREQDNRSDEEVSETDSTRKVSDSSFFIFEEPELFLHPQAQKELFSSLRVLSKDHQVFLTTHSSFFINLNDYKSICIAHKEPTNNSTSICQCTEELFQDLDDKKKFNLAYWINPDRGELFFAKKVILVEGATEKTVIPYIAKQLLEIFKYDYTIIDCGGKDNIPLYVELLNKFKRPYIVTYDKDHQSSKSTDAINSANIASNLIERKIDSQLGQTIVFENDIDEEIGILEQNMKGKPAIALAHIEDSSFQLTDQLKQKVSTIYS